LRDKLQYSCCSTDQQHDEVAKELSSHTHTHKKNRIPTVKEARAFNEVEYANCLFGCGKGITSERQTKLAACLIVVILVLAVNGFSFWFFGFLWGNVLS